MRAQRWLPSCLPSILFAAAALAQPACLSEDQAGPAPLLPGGGPAPGRAELAGYFTGRDLKFDYDSLSQQYRYFWVVVRLYFLDDGRVYRISGKLGLLDQFDVAAAIAREPQNTGTWQRSGDELTITWPSNRVWTAKLGANGTFRLAKGAGNFNGITLQQPARIAPRLAGSYYNSTHTPTDSMGSSVSGEHWVTFGADGRVQIHDSVLLVGTPLSQLSDQIIRGSYQIDGYTMRVTAGSESLAFNVWVIEGDPANPTLIEIDGAGYLRK